MTAFPCLACPEVSAPGSYYCATCLAQGRTMRAAGPGPSGLADSAGSAVAAVLPVSALDRDVVHVDCPACAERSPAFADVDRASCLHCFAVLDLTPARVRSAGAMSLPIDGGAPLAGVPAPVSTA